MDENNMTNEKIEFFRNKLTYMFDKVIAEITKDISEAKQNLKQSGITNLKITQHAKTILKAAWALIKKTIFMMSVSDNVLGDDLDIDVVGIKNEAYSDSNYKAKLLYEKINKVRINQLGNLGNICQQAKNELIDDDIVLYYADNILRYTNYLKKANVKKTNLEAICIILYNEGKLSDLQFKEITALTGVYDRIYKEYPEFSRQVGNKYDFDFNIKDYIAETLKEYSQTFHTDYERTHEKGRISK